MLIVKYSINQSQVSLGFDSSSPSNSLILFFNFILFSFIHQWFVQFDYILATYSSFSILI